MSSYAEYLQLQEQFKELEARSYKELENAIAACNKQMQDEIARLEFLIDNRYYSLCEKVNGLAKKVTKNLNLPAEVEEE